MGRDAMEKFTIAVQMAWILFTLYGLLQVLSVL